MLANKFQRLKTLFFPSVTFLGLIHSLLRFTEWLYNTTYKILFLNTSNLNNIVLSWNLHCVETLSTR